MNVKGFFVAALSSALDLGIATPDDVLRHVTPDVLSRHLPRPLWARLLTACVGASRVDAQLVVETIGVPNLCEHVPSTIIWACLAEVAQRSLSGAAPERVAVPRPIASNAGSASRPIPLATPPPPPEVTPVAASGSASGRTSLPSVLTIPPARSSSDPVADVASSLNGEDRPAAPTRSRTSTQQRFRQSNTGIGRLASTTAARRPQAQAAPPESATPARPRRGQTESDAYDVETDVKDDWKSALAVEDEQLVDWAASDETLTTTDDYSGRKR